MSAKNLSLRDLSEKTGINYEMIRRYSKGQAKPRNDKMKLLAQCLGVPITWLDYGEGEMTKNNDKLTPITEWDDSTPLDDDEAEIPFYKDIAFACGHGAVNGDAPLEGRKLRMGRRTLSNLGVMPINAYAVTACDDSMTPLDDGLYFAVIFLHFNHVKVVYLKMLGRIWGDVGTRIILPIYDKPTAFSRIADFGVGVDSFFNGFG
ncbi:hypothetical protein [Moraxella phage Mcat28]|nr:hypothetical protein [Moraxella phage Mcat28]